MGGVNAQRGLAIKFILRRETEVAKKKHKHYTPEEIEEIFDQIKVPSRDVAEKVQPFLEGLFKYYFRVTVKGWNHVPAKPALYICNHNGVLTWEVLMLFYGWWRKFGFRKRAVGLAHDVATKNPLFSWLLPKLGAIPANPDVAYAAFEHNYSVLVFPGGLKEAYRPYKEKEKVDFFGRKGFIRLALKAKVPIVPVVSVGAHESYIILDRGEALAKKLGIKDKYHIDGLPLTPQSIFFMWCMATGLLTFFPLLLAPAAFASIFMPLPAKMEFHILEPVDVCSMVDPNLSDDENHAKIYDHILGAMQRASTKAYKNRKLPIIG